MAYRFNLWKMRVLRSSSKSGQSARMSRTNRASCWSLPEIPPDCSLAKSPAATRWTTPVDGKGKVVSSGDRSAPQLKSGSSATSLAAAGAGRSVTRRSTVCVRRVKASSNSGGAGRLGGGLRGERASIGSASSSVRAKSSSEVGVAWTRGGRGGSGCSPSIVEVEAPDRNSGILKS